MNKAILAIFLIYTGNTLTTLKDGKSLIKVQDQSEQTSTNTTSKSTYVDCEYIQKISDNLINYQYLAQVLLEVRQKLRNYDARDIGPKAVFFYYLMEENCEIGGELLQPIADGMLNQFQEQNYIIRFCFNTACDLVDIYNSFAENKGKLDSFIVPDYIQELADHDNLISELINSLHNAAEILYALRLIDADKIISIVNNNYLESFDNFHNLLATINMPVELKDAITTAIKENIYFNKPVSYTNLTNLLIAEKENIQSFNCVKTKLQLLRKMYNMLRFYIQQLNEN